MTALLSLALLHWAVLLTPGANFVLLAQLASSGHRREAVLTTLGITAATFTWAMLAALGLGTLLALHPILHQGVQWAGGLYLFHLAWRMAGLFPSHTGRQTAAPASVRETRSALAWLRLGWFTNILNPKTALFFTSVFALALPAPAGPGMLSAAVVLCYVNALVWHLILALAFSRPAVQRFHQHRHQVINRGCAVLMTLFGLRLLWPLGA